MSAASFFYAGSLELHWQLLIVVIFLFSGTLAFFSVLFNETSDELNAPLLTSTVQVNGNEYEDETAPYAWEQQANEHARCDFEQIDFWQ